MYRTFKEYKFLKTCTKQITCLSKFSSNQLPRAKIWKLLAATGIATGIVTGIASYNVLLSQNRPSDNNLRAKFNFINKIVEECAPAVVYVEIKDPRRIDKFTDNAQIVSNGSGFIIGEEGWILTNAHVVVNKPNAKIEVKLYDGSIYSATVEDADMNADLALIKISPDKKLRALRLGKSGDVSVGEWVVAMGSPLSLSHSATAGVVSSVSRNAEELGLRNYQMKYIQTDAPITFGNSGGPLVNLDGDVIGVNNLRITAGISFAIPVGYVTKFLDRAELKKVPKKKKQENILGITTLSMTSAELSKNLAPYKDLKESINHGVLVWKLLHNGLAEQGGLVVGDIITHINGKPIYKAGDVYINMIDSSEKITFTLIRDGSRMDVILFPTSWKSP